MSGPKPLDGITVADFSELLPGPFMTGALAEMGARIIKIERPGGDGLRQSQPGTFGIVNRGKESVTLDLKSGADRKRAEEIVRAADVMVEGFRPGVMARLGLGYEAMAEVKEGHYFVLGDNRQHSSDSREFGQVPIELLKGKVEVRLWPPARLGILE